MTIIEQPNDGVYRPIANNLIWELEVPNAYRIEVVIDNSTTLVFYPINNKYWINLKETVQSIYLDTRSPFGANISNIKINSFNTLNSTVETLEYNFTFIPYGIDYNNLVPYVLRSEANPFIASRKEVYRFEGYPLEVLGYEFDGATFNAIERVMVVNKQRKCGTYISWLNRLGGRSSWLFSKGNYNATIRDKGSINNDFRSIEKTFVPTITLGKEVNPTVSVHSGLLLDNEIEFVTEIFYSPSVYVLDEKNMNWLGIDVTNTTAPLIRENKNSLEFVLNFEFSKANNIIF